jgi:acetyl esterase/lipase
VYSFDDVLRAARAAAPPSARIVYGESSSAFGNLWLPSAAAETLPTVVFIHGGCWQSEYGVDHVAAAAESLLLHGYAVWAPEYRRLGELGGGWPNTFDDVGAAIDHLRILSTAFPIDLARVVIAGHSAGGQLAVWSATRSGGAADTVQPVGVLSLAGILDLAAYSTGDGNCNGAVVPLLGGTPGNMPARYAATSPIERLPIGTPVAIVHGALDATVPVAMSETFAERAQAAGDAVLLTVLRDAGHFDVIAPGTSAWEAVLNAVQSLVEHT